MDLRFTQMATTVIDIGGCSSVLDVEHKYSRASGGKRLTLTCTAGTQISLQCTVRKILI